MRCGLRVGEALVAEGVEVLDHHVGLPGRGLEWPADGGTRDHDGDRPPDQVSPDGGRIGVIGGRDLSYATDSLKAGMAGEVRAEQGRNRR